MGILQNDKYWPFFFFNFFNNMVFTQKKSSLCVTKPFALGRFHGKLDIPEGRSLKGKSDYPPGPPVGKWIPYIAGLCTNTVLKQAN